MTKSGLLESIENFRQQLEANLLEIPMDRMTTSQVNGLWSVKEIQAHLTIWETRTTHWLREIAQGCEPHIQPAGMIWINLMSPPFTPTPVPEPILPVSTR